MLEIKNKGFQTIVLSISLLSNEKYKSKATDIKLWSYGPMLKTLGSKKKR